MINKDAFCDIFDTIKEYYTKINKMDDYNCILCNKSILEEIILDLFCEIFNENQIDVVFWWIYGTNFGKNFEFGSMIDNNSKEIDLSDSGKLYEYLLNYE